MLRVSPRVIWIGLLLLTACGGRAQGPHRELAGVWRDYRELPAQRALAVAGDLRNDRWVAGASGGHGSVAEARSEAL